MYISVTKSAGFYWNMMDLNEIVWTWSVLDFLDSEKKGHSLRKEIQTPKILSQIHGSYG